MRETDRIEAAAQLFKVLGGESRLRLLMQLRDGPATVGSLAAAVEMTQPLVSQHLKTLRQAGLVAAVRSGREVSYAIADDHVSHVVADALAHVDEPAQAHHPEPQI